MSAAAGGSAPGLAPAWAPGPYVATVTTWDDERGWGTVTIPDVPGADASGDGTVAGLHCTALADGSRTTEVGRQLVVRLRPGRHGAWEAAEAVALA